MAQEIIIPQFGTSVDTVTILSWKFHEGDKIQKGDLLCEVETDKAAMEIESFYTGTLIKILAEEGDSVAIGQKIAYVGTPGEEVPVEREKPAVAEKISPEVKAMPKVRKLARELGVDLQFVEPGGSRGEITAADVRNSAERTGKTVLELSKNQQAVATRITQSYNEIVPITLNATINVRSILQARKNRAKDSKPVIDAFFALAVARAMERFPLFQYYFDKNRCVHAGGANIGIAISTDEELYIPVVKNRTGDNEPIYDVEFYDRKIRGFRKKANNGNFKQEDFEKGVFLLSNLGMYPVDFFTVIIPPRYSAALSIGRITTYRECLVSDSSTTIDEQMVRVMLSVDHRFINGRLAAQFIEEIKTLIETSR